MVTLYERWGDEGFEPKAHVEVAVPSLGLTRSTPFVLGELPQLTPLAEHDAVRELTSADEQAIRGIVHQLHAAYEAGDVDHVLAFEEMALNNMWEIYGIDSKKRAELLESTRQQLAEAFASSWQLDSLPIDLSFTLHEGMVKVSASQPIIAGVFVTEGIVYVGTKRQTTPGKGQVKRTVLYLIKANGEWRIVKFN